MALPAILNPFIEGAPACVMTRIALDWIIEATPFDQLFEEVAEDQYTREFTLTHFVQLVFYSNIVTSFSAAAYVNFLD